jgi:hypothetical protein
VNLVRIYKALLRLYPSDYRRLFSAEMGATFEESVVEHRGQLSLSLRFAISELVGLLVALGDEWIAKLTSDDAVRARSVPDLRLMRPPGVSREEWFSRGLALPTAIGTNVNVRRSSLPDEVVEAEARLRAVLDQMVSAISNRKYDQARLYSYQELEYRESLHLLMRKYKLDGATCT